MSHIGLTNEHWNKFSLMEQLSNVGCDVSRAIRWRNKGNQPYSEDAFWRAFELLGLTIMDPKNKNQLKELARTREVLVDYFLYDNVYKSTDELWEKYFYYFGFVAAEERMQRQA